MRYQVTDDQDRQSYQGPFTQAFVSGLSDGEFAFNVTALNADGDVIANSSQPAQLTVRHWSLTQAIALMSVGFVVFVSVVVVIIRGWLSSAPQKPNATA